VIDYFALIVSHGLILIALIRIVGRAELDEDPEIEARRAKKRRRRDDA